MTNLTTTGVPPGWYRDPWGQATWRWWSGVEWTPHTDGRRRRSAGRRPAGRPAGRAAPRRRHRDPRLPRRARDLDGITVVLILFGYTVEDPALLLGSSLGLWVGMFGSCVIAVRTKGTGSLADLGLVKPRWVDVALGAGFAVAGVVMVSILGAILNLIGSDLLPGGRNDLTSPADHGARSGSSSST